MAHIPRLTTDKQAVLEGKLTHLRMYLALAMRELRTEANLTQKELATSLGVQQAAVSKLESHNRDHKLESIVRQLAALDAELLVAVKKGDDIFQVSDDEAHLLVDLPAEVADWADEAGVELREYVMDAVEHHRDFSSQYPTGNMNYESSLQSNRYGYYLQESQAA